MSKLTPKQEGFCLSYIETGNASEAYRLNYDAQNMAEATINSRASKLVKEYKISTRLAELQEQHQERHDITVDSLTAMYKEDRQDAREVNQYSSAIAAVTGLGRLHGLIVDKKDVTVTKRTAPELDAFLRSHGVDPEAIEKAVSKAVH